MRIYHPDSVQIPVEIIDDFMPRSTESEFKVLMRICRVSFAPRSIDDVSPTTLTALEKTTGLTRSSINAALKVLMGEGLVGRVRDGRGYRYFPGVGGQSEVVTPVEKKASPKPKTETGPSLFGPIAKACGQGAPFTRPMAGRIVAAQQILLKSGVTPQEIDGLRELWVKEDWRGRKGDDPTPEQLVDFCGKMRARGKTVTVRVDRREAERAIAAKLTGVQGGEGTG